MSTEANKYYTSLRTDKPNEIQITENNKHNAARELYNRHIGSKKTDIPSVWPIYIDVLFAWILILILYFMASEIFGFRKANRCRRMRQLLRSF